MKAYQNSQIGTLLLVLYSIVIVILAVLALFTQLRRVAMTGLLVMTVVVVLFSRLTVKIKEEMVELRFGLGILRKRYLLRDIEACQVVNNPWYYGWGIRYTPQGWLYAVSGLTAVELQMKNGKKVRIGTDDAYGLCQALERALGVVSGGL